MGTIASIETASAQSENLSEGTARRKAVAARPGAREVTARRGAVVRMREASKACQPPGGFHIGVHAKTPEIGRGAIIKKVDGSSFVF